MIGTGLRNLASQYGMKSAHGIAYGAMNGYCTTLSEGAGFKQIVFATRFAEATQRYAFTEAVHRVNLSKEYRVNEFLVQEDRIVIVFNDTIGTMKRIEAFVAWILPILDQYGASKVNVCCHCGLFLDNGSWKLIDGVAMYGHEACAQKLTDKLTQQVDAKAVGGSYLTGAAGALLGAALGAVVWAILYMTGWIFSVVGFLIGLLTEKGYNLLKGKIGKGKLAILIIAIIFGVLLGNFSGFVLKIIKEADYTVAEAVELVTENLQDNSEFQSVVVKDLILCLLFAGIGVFTLLRDTRREIATPKCIDLE